MSLVDFALDAGKRVGAAVLAVLVFAFAIFSFFQGLVLFSIILHIVGFALVVYIAYQSAPPQ